MARPLYVATLVSALALSAGGALAQTTSCVLDTEGALAQDCRQGNPNARPSGAIAPNVPTTQGPRNDLGFSIRIGAPTPQAQDVAEVGQEGVGRLLEQMGVGIQATTLGAAPRLNVVVADLRDRVGMGDTLSFQAASNYPAWIAKAEVVVLQGRDVIARLPVAPNGTVAWTVPNTSGRLSYRLDVTDAQGRVDQTKARPLWVAEQGSPAPFQSKSIAAILDEDRTEKRAIPVQGGAVRITGTATEGTKRLRVMGETITVAAGETFSVERILPPGGHGVVIEADGPQGPDSLTERVDIPKADGFATGMLDLTFGQGYQTGRIAAYAERTRADGSRIVLRIDTQERALDDLFSDLFEKDPRKALAGVNPMEPFLTYGDDSTRTDLAPASGPLFLEWTRRSNRVTWGDIDTGESARGLAQENRTLYGLQGEWNSVARTEQGEARTRATGYAAAAGSATQQDTLETTGASVFFLSRRDILAGSAKIRVETRDDVTGQVLTSQTLQEGTDYRLNTLQGVVTFNTAPGLGPQPSGTDSWVVVSYEYTPTSPLDGTVAGGRLESWLGETVRVGIEGRVDESTTPTTRVIAGDILYAPTERSQILVELAESLGPGRETNLSTNGGLTQETTADGASAKARALRITGETDLADWGNIEGTLEGQYFREEQGFVGSEGVADTDRERARLAGTVNLSKERTLSFGARMDNRQGGLDEKDAWISMAIQKGPRTLTFGIEHIDRDDPSGQARRLGSRTNALARLETELSPTARWWVYGQATLAHSGGAGRDDRLGAGIQADLRSNMAVDTDLSYGTLGWGWTLGLSQKDERGSRRIGYTLDPDRRFDEAGFRGKDRGMFVASADTAYSDTLRATAEARYDAFGARPSSQTRYGLAWTPRAGMQYDLAFLTGQSTTEDGDTVEKQGLTLGLRRTTPNGLSYGLRGEWIRDRSDDALDPSGNVDTFALVGDLESRVSEDWRLVGTIDGLWSDSPVTGVGTGRYLETQMGFAYRPAQSDDTIGLLSYTFLLDDPAAGQRNFDGDLDGDGQRSHILNAAISHRFNPEWTVAAKYGLRHRTLLPASGGSGDASWTQMAAVRVDYHMNNTWDLSGEVRGMWHSTGSQETGALVTVHRALNENVRIGLGYAWGGVSDDLRTVAPAKEGLFLNLTASF